MSISNLQPTLCLAAPHLDDDDDEEKDASPSPRPRRSPRDPEENPEGTVKFSSGARLRTKPQGYHRKSSSTSRPRPRQRNLFLHQQLPAAPSRPACGVRYDETHLLAHHSDRHGHGGFDGVNPAERCAQGTPSALPATSRVLIHQPLISGRMVGPATDINIQAKEMKKSAPN